jgi:hypothetical protein
MQEFNSNSSTNKIYVITKREEFNSIYDEFKNSALLKLEPNIYLIGLDIEYICKSNYPNSFKNYKNWLKVANEIAVCKLQLSTKSISIVIDLCKFTENAELPDNLIKILKSDAWIKTGVGISSDIAYLSTNYCLGQCNGCIDMKTYAQLKGLDCSLIGLYNTITGSNDKKNKKDSICDWTQSLTEEQIQYTAHDGYMSYIVGKHFISNIIDKLDNDKVESTINTIDISINYVGRINEHAQKYRTDLPKI